MIDVTTADAPARSRIHMRDLAMASALVSAAYEQAMRAQGVSLGVVTAVTEQARGVVAAAVTGGEHRPPEDWPVTDEGEPWMSADVAARLLRCQPMTFRRFEFHTFGDGRPLVRAMRPARGGPTTTRATWRTCTSWRAVIPRRVELLRRRHHERQRAEAARDSSDGTRPVGGRRNDPLRTDTEGRARSRERMSARDGRDSVAPHPPFRPEG
jgi:hypothetical protein